MSVHTSGEMRPPRALRTNPYVGLTTFDREDSLFFFGRREQTTALLGILGETRFLPIVGGSGSGKSSLVRAGLIPQLDAGFLVRDSDRWRIAIMRPGDGPIANLAQELVRQFDDGRPDAAATLTAGIARRRAAAIVEYVQERREDAAARDRKEREEKGETPRERKENLLILVDQFEEVFSFRLAKGSPTSVNRDDREEYARRNKEAADFVDALLKVAEQDDVLIHVVVTMRSDFLGDCDLFFGLPEAMNKAQYLIPRMSRQALREAVAGPPQIFGATVAPRLIDKVLNDLGARQDRLPVLQHALLRTWDAWDAGGRIGLIDLQHFQAAGGLDMALEQDANAAAAGFDEDVVGRIFRALTDTDVQERRIRHPAFVEELEAVAGAPPETVRAIIESFKGDDRNFLYESTDSATGKQRIDISHESLIRQWSKLESWVDQERAGRDQYLQYVHDARAWERHDKELLTGADLALASEWKREFDPQDAWAKRYEQDPGDETRRSDYALMVDYIDASARHAHRTRIIRRRLTVAGVAILSVISLTAARQAWNAVAAREEAIDLTRVISVDQLAGTDPQAAAMLALELHPPKRVGGLDFIRSALLLKVAASAIPQLTIEHVAAAAMDSSASHVAAALTNGTIEIFDISGIHVTGAPWLLRDSSQRESFTRMAFSHDGNFLATSTATGQVQVWAVRPGAKPVTWRIPGTKVTELSFDASGDFVMASADSEDYARAFMFVWEHAGSTRLRLYGTGCLSPPRFSPTKRGLLMAACDLTPAEATEETAHSRIIQLNAASFQTIHEFPRDAWPLAFSGDGKWILLDATLVRSDTSARSTFSVFDVEKQSMVGPPKIYETRADPVVNRDGSKVALARGDDLVVYQPGGGKEMATRLPGRVSAIHGFFENNGAPLVLLQTEYNAVRIVNPATGTTIPLKGHTEDLRSVTAAGDSTLLTVGEDNTARIWKRPFRHDRQTLPGLASKARVSANVAMNGTRVFTAYKDTDEVMVQDLTGARAVRRWKEPGFKAATYDKNGEYLAIMRTSSPPIVRGLGNTVVELEDPHEELRWVLRFTPRGDFVYGTGQAHAFMWERATGRLLHTRIALQPREFVLSALDSTSFLTRGDRGLRFRHPGDDVSDTTVIRGVYDGGVTKDGKYYMTVGANAALYRASDGVKLRNMGSRMPVTTWSSSHDGTRIVTGTENGLLNIWKLDGLKKEPSIVLHGHTDRIRYVSFSPNDSLIVSTSADGTVRVWNAHGKGQPIVLDAGNAAYAFATPDNGVIAVGDRILLWTLDPAKLNATIDSATTSCLPVAFRMETLGEREGEARQNRNACEKRHGRPPTS